LLLSVSLWLCCILNVYCFKDSDLLALKPIYYTHWHYNFKVLICNRVQDYGESRACEAESF
jgi:hypothetical protein